MRILLLVVWLLIPVGAVAYHFGPGQSRLKLDHASELLRLADQNAADEQWQAAEAAYLEALGLIPDEQLDLQRRVRLELCKVQMLNRQLPTAHEELASLHAELMNDPTAERALLADVQSAFAQTQYYMTWLMRLEGQPRERWEPEIEAAQQTYRLLATQAENEGDVGSLEVHRKDLESAVRLARMDLGELQSLPLPSQ